MICFTVLDVGDGARIKELAGNIMTEKNNGGGITIRESKLVRIAAEIGRTAAACTTIEHDALLNQFIQDYDPDRPCEYLLDCLRDGRCPMSPSCDGKM